MWGLIFAIVNENFLGKLFGGGFGLRSVSGIFFCI